MTFHGRENIEDILKVINNGKTTIALPSRKVKDMAQFLLDNNVDESRKVVVCERLSYPDERIVEATLKDIANSEFTYMCIMTICHIKSIYSYEHLFYYMFADYILNISKSLSSLILFSTNKKAVKIEISTAYMVRHEGLEPPTN